MSDDLIGTASCMPGFRGCPFINAAAETPDPEDPIRIVVERHRQWTRSLFATYSGEAGAVDADATGGQVMMLRDGAMVRGYLEDPEKVADELRRAVGAVVTAGHRREDAYRCSFIRDLRDRDVLRGDWRHPVSDEVLHRRCGQRQIIRL